MPEDYLSPSLMIVSAERLINWIQLSAILTVLPLSIGPAAQTKTLGSEETFTATSNPSCLSFCGEAGAAVQVAGCAVLGVLLGHILSSAALHGGCRCWPWAGAGPAAWRGAGNLLSLPGALSVGLHDSGSLLGKGVRRDRVIPQGSYKTLVSWGLLWPEERRTQVGFTARYRAALVHAGTSSSWL